MSQKSSVMQIPQFVPGALMSDRSHLTIAAKLSSDWGHLSRGQGFPQKIRPIKGLIVIYRTVWGRIRPDTPFVLTLSATSGNHLGNLE